MRLWLSSRKRQTNKQPSAPKLNKELLTRILDFSRSVEVLRLPAKMTIDLISQNGAKAQREKEGSTYYLLVYSDELPYEYMNAGYAAGQILAYLCFLGIPAVLPNGIPTWAKEKNGQKCITAVAFGSSLPSGRRLRQSSLEDVPCIYHDYREHWSEEVLRYVKKRFPTSLRAVRAVHEEGRICIVQKNTFARKTALSEYEAGLAAARIMTAAEELWMDLTFAETNEAQCLISVCRRTDSVKLNRRVPEKAGVGAKAVPLYS